MPKYTLESGGPTGPQGPAGPTSVFAGASAPNGVQVATGPAIYLQTQPGLPPIMWFKTTAGTTNNEWN